MIKIRKVMKHFSYVLIACFAALTLAACHEKPNGPQEPDKVDYSQIILGTFRLESAMQDNGSSNPVDMTPMYGGSDFVLTFKENGVLICANSIEDAQMEYVLDGENLDFIQAPGADPVRYKIDRCDDAKLVIIHGIDTDYITTLTLKREK